MATKDSRDFLLKSGCKKKKIEISSKRDIL